MVRGCLCSNERRILLIAAVTPFARSSYWQKICRSWRQARRKLVSCKEKYWEFVRLLRTDKRIIRNFKILCVRIVFVSLWLTMLYTINCLPKNNLVVWKVVEDFPKINFAFEISHVYLVYDTQINVLLWDKKFCETFYEKSSQIFFQVSICGCGWVLKSNILEGFFFNLVDELLFVEKCQNCTFCVKNYPIFFSKKVFI